MTKKPFGVWFTVALAVLAVSAWVGWKVGARVAIARYRSRQQTVGMLSASERADVESELSGLSAVGTLLLYAPVNDKELRKKFLPSSISGLESLGRQSSMQPIKPVIDLNLGIAYVNAAITKEQEGNVQQSMNYMKSAQSLFYSLGWEDYSEETLRAVARRDRDRWNGDLQVKARRK